MDPVSWMVTGLTRLGIGLGILVGDGLHALFLGAARGMNGSTSSQSRKLTKVQKSEEAENQRLAGCKQVVLEFAEVLGFIARECISRTELEHLIDNGIEPEDLAGEMNRRIAAKPGIILGEYHFGNGSKPRSTERPPSTRLRTCSGRFVSSSGITMRGG